MFMAVVIRDHILIDVIVLEYIPSVTRALCLRLTLQRLRAKTMKIFYFAWLKEHTGCSCEDMRLPDGVDTVGELIPHITRKSSGHKTALANLEAVRVAVNRVYGDLQRQLQMVMRLLFSARYRGVVANLLRWQP